MTTVTVAALPRPLDGYCDLHPSESAVTVPAGRRGWTPRAESRTPRTAGPGRRRAGRGRRSKFRRLLNRRPAGIMMIMTRSEGGTVTVTVTGVELPARWAGLGPRPYQPPDSYSVTEPPSHWQDHESEPQRFGVTSQLS